MKQPLRNLSKYPKDEILIGKSIKISIGPGTVPAIYSNATLSSQKLIDNLKKISVENLFPLDDQINESR